MRQSKPISGKLPDAINCSTTRDFTQVPNEALENSEMSLKSKGLLAVLLRNKDGWKSYISGIKKTNKDGPESINTGLKELESFGYLLRFRYRDKNSKIWKGSFWAYTDRPFVFYIKDQFLYLTKKGYEIAFYSSLNPEPDFPDLDIPDMDKPDLENPHLIILNNNNTKVNKIEVEVVAKKERNLKENGKHITPSGFEEFWAKYPRKVQKGKALTAWEKICNKKPKERPTRKEILSAIHHQKKSEQWREDIQFVPYPSTWLNQKRWMDSPENMKVHNYNKNKLAYTDEIERNPGW